MLKNPVVFSKNLNVFLHTECIQTYYFWLVISLAHTCNAYRNWVLLFVCISLFKALSALSNLWILITCCVLMKVDLIPWINYCYPLCHELNKNKIFSIILFLVKLAVYIWMNGQNNYYNDYLFIYDNIFFTAYISTFICIFIKYHHQSISVYSSPCKVWQINKNCYCYILISTTENETFINKFRLNRILFFVQYSISNVKWRYHESVLDTEKYEWTSKAMLSPRE